MLFENFTFTISVIQSSQEFRCGFFAHEVKEYIFLFCNIKLRFKNYIIFVELGIDVLFYVLHINNLKESNSSNPVRKK